MVKKIDYGQYNVLIHLMESPFGLELVAFDRICTASDFGRLLGEDLITVEDQHIVKATEAGRIACQQFPILKIEENPIAKFHRQPPV